MTVKGLDVSYWQGKIGWAQVPPEYKFVFIRTGDTLFEDPRFTENWEGAKARGLLRGAYHYIRPTKSPDMQMNLIRSAVPTDDLGELPFVLDIEYVTSSVSKSSYRAHIGEFLAQADEWFVRPSIIYTGIDQWKDIIYHWWKLPPFGTPDHPDWLAGHPLWVADRGRTTPRLPIGWTEWLFYQHSSEGRIPGISGDVDLNVFNGTEAQLMAYAGVSNTEPADEEKLEILWQWAKRHDPGFMGGEV